MTDQSTRERLAEINRIGTLWPNGWTRTVAKEYELALRNTPANQISWGISRAMQTRTTRPAPAQILQIIDEAVAEKRAAQRRDAASTVGEGQGCPHCRNEGARREWVNGSPTLAYCPTHNYAWRGQVPEQHDPLRDDVLPDDIWLSKALRGDLGRVCQTIARRRTAAANRGEAPAPDAPLQDVLKEITHA